MKMPPNAQRASIVAILAMFTATFISGCESYQLGNPVELPFESIYIKPATNDSFAPQVQALLSAQIRDAFIRDGRTKLVINRESADAVLLVNVTEYSRRAAANRRVDTALASSFNLSLAANISLFNQNEGGYYFQERKIRKTSRAYVENPYASRGTGKTQNFLQSEYQAMPRLTRDLARRIADEVLNPWEPR
jgi:hypothetical protein